MKAKMKRKASDGEQTMVQGSRREDRDLAS